MMQASYGRPLAERHVLLFFLQLVIAPIGNLTTVFVLAGPFAKEDLGFFVVSPFAGALFGGAMGTLFVPLRKSGKYIWIPPFALWLYVFLLDLSNSWEMASELFYREGEAIGAVLITAPVIACCGYSLAMWMIDRFWPKASMRDFIHRGHPE